MTTSTAENTGTKITEDAISALRAKIGRESRTREEPNLEEATKDAIRHWVRAIGDRDPKWTDEAYAASTRFGGITAPPSMLYAFDIRAIGDRSGLPGIHSFFAGADHEWLKPIRRNDSIRLRVVLKDLVEKKSNFAGRMFQQISEVTFLNQDDEVVARSWPWGMRTERRTASDRGKYKELEPAHYTKEDIERIDALYAAEPDSVRGATPRYWEDVNVGDPIGSIIRGPWTATTSICFLHAHGGMFMKAHSYWYDYLRRHPRAGLINEQGIPEGPVRGHWDSNFARTIGVPAAYDYGPERIAWLCTLATYWCGDAGDLRRLKVEVRRFNLQGDLTTVSGTVRSKAVVGGEHQVECDITAVDQRGTQTAAAVATIALPSRDPHEGE